MLQRRRYKEEQLKGHSKHTTAKEKEKQHL